MLHLENAAPSLLSRKLKNVVQSDVAGTCNAMQALSCLVSVPVMVQNGIVYRTYVHLSS